MAKESMINQAMKIKVRYIFLILFLLYLIWCSLSSDDKRLGKGYVYDPEHRAILYTRPGELKNSDIPPYVLGYNYDRYFIVARQKPKKFYEEIYGKYDYPFSRDMTYFWIIVKADRKVLGPLDETSYWRLADSLGINPEVKRGVSMNLDETSYWRLADSLGINPENQRGLSKNIGFFMPVSDRKLDSNGRRTGYWPYSYGRLNQRAYYKGGLLNGEFYDRYYLSYDSEIFGHYKNGEIDGKWIMNYKQETDVLNNYCPVMVELYDFTVKSKTPNDVIYHCKIKDYYSDGTIIDREKDISNFIRDEDGKRHHSMFIHINELNPEFDSERDTEYDIENE